MRLIVIAASRPAMIARSKTVVRRRCRVAWRAALGDAGSHPVRSLGQLSATESPLILVHQMYRMKNPHLPFSMT
jgi:hypothetical protein